MNNFWKLSTGILLGASLALSGCDLGSSDGSTDSGGATPPPVTPASYTGSTTAAALTAGNQTTAGTAATNTTGGLINNAANGGLNNIIGPISVVADSTPRASNATIISLFASLNFDGQNQPAAVVSQNFDNPAPCTVASPASAITYYLTGKYIVVTFTDACLAVLPGTSPANEATVNGQVVVTVSDDGDHYTFTPSSLTVTDNAAATTYNVPAGTYELDKSVTPAKLSILVPCHNNKKVCKITAPTDLSATSPYSFTDATVSDPELGHFNVAGTGLVLCTAGDSGTPDSPFQAGGSLTLTTVPASLTVTVTFGGCGVDLVITP